MKRHDADAAKRLVHLIIEQYIPTFVRLREEIRLRYKNCLDEM